MSWPMKALGDVGEWFGGGTPSKSRVEFWSGGTIPWISPKDMGPRVIDVVQDRITVAAVEQSSLRRVPAGAVAVVVRSGILERTFPVGIVPFEATFNQDMRAVSPSADVDVRWLASGLRAFERQILRDTRKAGTTVASIEWPRFKEFQLPIPPLDEQHRIVDILEDHLSRLDAAKCAMANGLKRLDALVTSILIDLIPDERDYPSTWKRSTVAEAGKVELGRQRHPDWHTGSKMKPYLRVANVFEDRIDSADVAEMHWPEDTFERYKLEPGDVLLNEGQIPRLLGRPALYRGDPPEVAFTKTLMRFQAGPHVLPEFALLVFRRHMRAGRFKRESRITTNIAHLPVVRLKPIEFPVPSLDEQAKIVSAARECFEEVKRLQDQLDVTDRRSSQLRREVLSAAFTGRLTRATANARPIT